MMTPSDPLQGSDDAAFHFAIDSNENGDGPQRPNPPPTPAQRKSMRQDCYWMPYLQQYCRFYMKNLALVTMPWSAVPAIDASRDNPEKIPNVELYYSILGVLKKSEDPDFALRFNREFIIKVGGVSILYHPHLDEKAQYTLRFYLEDDINHDTEDGIGVGEGKDITLNEETFAQLIRRERAAPVGSFLLYLYILDLYEIATRSREQGQKATRFLPFYPTKSMNKRIFDRDMYLGPFNIMRHTASRQGVEIENLNQITYEQYEEMYMLLKKASEEKDSVGR